MAGDVISPGDLIFGVEIEMLAPKMCSTLLSRWEEMLPNIPVQSGEIKDKYVKGEERMSFTFCSDTSIAPNPSWKPKIELFTMELVSPVFGLSYLDRFKDVCAFLQLQGARTSTTCGMHVHIGFKEDQPLLRFARVHDHFSKWRENSAFKKRLSHIDPKLAITEHHNVVQMRSRRHYEVRCFNSSVKYRAVKNAVMTCARVATASLVWRDSH